MSKKLLTVIDIGSSKICTVISNIEDDKKVSVIGVANYPSRGIKKGVVINIDDATNAIAESLEASERMAGVTVSSAVISISGKHIACINNKGVVAVSKDEITPEDVARAIESAKTISVPPTREILHSISREFILDNQGCIKDPLGMSGIRLEVDLHIISATASVEHNLAKCVNQVGLSINDTVFGGWAAAETVLTGTEKELGVLMLDIGAGVTSICVYQDESIYYSGCLELGGNNITSDLAIGLRLSLADAEKVKCEAGTLIKNAKVRKNNKENEQQSQLDNTEGNLMLRLGDLGIETTGITEIPRSLLDEIIDARLEEIFKSVREHLSYVGISNKFQAGIVLTGGCSKLIGITHAAQKYMSGPVRVGFSQGLYGLTDEINGPAYSVVHGMINYSLKYGFSNKETGKLTDTSKNIADRLKSWVRSFIP